MEIFAMLFAGSLEYQDFLRWKSEQTKKTEARMTSDVLSQRVTEEMAVMRAEIGRLKAGLLLIEDYGSRRGGTWCAYQARGHRLNLDYDAYPDTGVAPSPFPFVSGGE